MHTRHQIPSHSTTSHPTNSMESSPNHTNNHLTSTSPNIVELHSAIPHSPRLSSIDDETETDDINTRYTVYHTNKNKNNNNNNNNNTKKQSVKYKPTIKKSKSKTKLKSKTKYNTLTKPNISHKATHSSSSTSTSNTTNTSNSSNDISTTTDSPPIHPKSHTKNTLTTSPQFEPGYKRWKGANSIFCNGRIIAGPETKKQIRTLCMILIPVTIYFTTTCVILWSDYELKYAVLTAILIFLCVITFFFIVSCIDPGIIPRPQPHESSTQATDVINYISRHQHENNQVNKIQPTPPWEQRINIDGNIRVIKYCYTCHHFRPPRSFHCNNCDCCIERFDHHCPVLGNCIAKRNYHFYILFLISINTLCIWVCWTSLYIILDISTHYNNGSTTREIFINLWKYSPWPMVTLCLSIIAIFFPLILLFFHSYLIATGQTTNEKAKSKFTFVSPYSRGCMGNIWEIFCVINIPISNVHIHHQPPNKNDNEAIVNKKKIIYINSADTKLNYEERKLLHAKKAVKKVKNGIIEEEYKSSQSSMENNDPTPEEKVCTDIDTDDTFYSHKSNNNNYAHIKPTRTRRHHHNIGSNSSVDGLNLVGLNGTTYNTQLKLKRKRVIRSQSGYVNSHKNTHKRGKYMDTVSQPSYHHDHSDKSHENSDHNHKVHSTQSERIYYYNHDHNDGVQVHGYHPAYYKISQQESHKETFSFSPLSPVNSKEDHNGSVAVTVPTVPMVPYYPSPQNIAPIYHDKLTPLQTGTGTPILSINEDNRTLTSTFSHNNNHTVHYKNKRQNNLHRHYGGGGTGTNTNTNSTLFSPDISSGYGYMDNDNVSHTQTNHTNVSSSDYYTTVTAPSHAHTYHPHMGRNNRNPFNHPHHHGHPPPPSSLHQTVSNGGGNGGRRRGRRGDHRSYSHHHDRDGGVVKSNFKHKKGYSYGVNDILELSCASNRYDLNGNKYRNYNHVNHRPKFKD